jgi:SAM-dependent methyltransferase
MHDQLVKGQGTAAAPDPDKLNAFIGRAVSDMGAAMSAALVITGDKLGLYTALHERGPMTAGQLAECTGTHERYVREWLSAQAAGEYVTYDPAAKTFALTPEQAFLLADETSPLYLLGAFQIIQAMMADEPHVTERFVSGQGFGWHEHDERLFVGTERFFRPGYNAHLVAEWIPALEGVEAKLKEGAKVADVGCGLGASTILMAKAYPNSTFVGFDYHAHSIDLARKRAEAAGIGDRVRFEVASAQGFGGGGYDLIACFDCLHDMGDPVGAAKHIGEALAPGGTWLLVEPYANDKLEENLNPVGRVFYSASTMLCTPAALSQDPGFALGAQAGEARLRDVMTQAGLNHFRRAAETPFNLVLEVRR